MEWKWLNTTESDMRYKIVSQFLGDTSDKVILDLNCGQAGLRKYIPYKEYIANDVFEPEDLRGITFLKKKDDEIDIPCDILCLFGVGNGEMTQMPLESKSERESIKRLIRHNPKFVIIEMTQQWIDKYDLMSRYDEILKDYQPKVEVKLSLYPIDHYHNIRVIKIYGKN
jgi:hypothetical protein